MRNISKNAFTLTEFIVTSVMVSIVGSIAYFAYIGYGESARDSIRASDILKIIRTAEGYKLLNSQYPEPSNSINIGYSGATIWSQGMFGYNVDYSGGKTTKIPHDPVTDMPYAYSVTNSQKEYQVSSMYETFIVSNKIIPSANAEELKQAYAYIRGNYNGAVAKASNGDNTYVFALPSIFSTDLQSTDILDIIEQQNLVYHGGLNLTPNYKISKFNTKGGFEFHSPKLLFYETNNTKNLNKESEQILFFKNLQSAYNGTSVVQNGTIIERIVQTNHEVTPLAALKIAQSFIYNIIDKDLRP